MQVNTKEDFRKLQNVFFYDAAPNLNQFATPGSDFAKEIITKNPQLLVRLASSDITTEPTILNIEGFVFEPTDQYRINTGHLSAPKALITEENTEAYTLKPTWNKIENADFYEIAFNDMLYTTIQNTELLFEDLKAETPYCFKIRAANKDGYSDWTEFSATTKSNPLEFALPEIIGETSAENQGGQRINKLFDYDENNTWHTKYGVNSVPFTLTMDLKTINELDKFHYLPRIDAGNGTILKGSVSYSMDKENWTEAGNFEWARNNETKIFSFTNHPTARYIRLNITSALGGYGSGRTICF